MQLIERRETILSLFPGEALGRLTNAVFETVDKSFRDANGKVFQGTTQAEIRDRFTVCLDKAKILRGDLKWGLERIIGQLDEILRCHLAKLDYVPPTRACWIPDDGQ
jgi:hypothetical protein